MKIRSLLLAVGSIVCSPQISIARPLTSDGFILPSGNITCAFSENTRLRCDVLSGLKPNPKSTTCDLDWTGISMSTEGKPTPTCAGDTIFGNFPKLNYGNTWSRAGITCTAATSGLTCRNANGRGFWLSRDRWKIN